MYKEKRILRLMWGEISQATQAKRTGGRRRWRDRSVHSESWVSSPRHAGVGLDGSLAGAARVHTPGCCTLLAPGVLNSRGIMKTSSAEACQPQTESVEQSS